jgi:uncharacterized protein involved in cysteine biosynthesis
VKVTIKILAVVLILALIAIVIHHIPGFGTVMRKIHGG